LTPSGSLEKNPNWIPKIRIW